MAALKLITPAADFPVTLAETKAHLNVNFSDHDSLITLYIDAATNSAEKFTGRAFIDQTWELVHDSFPVSEIKIPLPPLIEILSVKYDDSNGDEQTIAAADYYVDDANQPGWIVPVTSAGWPTTLDAINTVRIQYRAGYEDSGATPQVAADRVPSAIKKAVLEMVGTYYAQRETVVIGVSVTKMPWAAEDLLRQYRVEKGMA